MRSLKENERNSLTGTAHIHYHRATGPYCRTPSNQRRVLGTEAVLAHRQLAKTLSNLVCLPHPLPALLAVPLVPEEGKLDWEDNGSAGEGGSVERARCWRCACNARERRLGGGEEDVSLNYRSSAPQHRRESGQTHLAFSHSSTPNLVHLTF